jgi:hypothetical protein
MSVCGMRMRMFKVVGAWQKGRTRRERAAGCEKGSVTKAKRRVRFNRRDSRRSYCWAESAS